MTKNRIPFWECHLHAAVTFGQALVLVLALGFLFPAAGAALPGATVTFGLRYDDCSALSPEDLERRILQICARTGVPVTFGVVPEIGKGDNHLPDSAGNLPLSQSRKDLLSEARSAGTLEIAMHGFAHRAASTGVRSEFAQVPAARQLEIIGRGKAELEFFAGPLATFIPPWNSYDGNTLSALDQTGFTVLSADVAGSANLSLGIRHVPATCLIPDVRRAIASARRSGGGIVIAYFHPYEFTEKDPKRGIFSLAEFESTLGWLAAQSDVQTLTLSEIGKLPAADPKTYQGFARWARLTPNFFEKLFRPLFWTFPQPAYPNFTGKLWVPLTILSGYFFLAFTTFIAAIGLFSWRRNLKAQSRSSKTRKGAVIITCVGVVAWTSGTWWALIIPAAVGAGCFGFGMGLWRISGNGGNEVKGPG